MGASAARLTTLALAAHWLLLATPALAQTSPADAGTRASISLCASELERPGLERALRDVTAGFSIPISHSAELPPAASAPGSIRIFVDVCAEEPRVEVVDAAGAHLVRSVPRQGVASELLNEQLAQIVRASLESLLEGVRPGIHAAPSEHVTARPRSEPQVARALLTPGAGLYYSATAYASAASLAHGPGGSFELRWGTLRPRWLAGAACEYRFIEHQQPSARLRLDVVPLRLFAGVTGEIGVAQLQLALGAGVDLVRVVPTAAELSERLVDPYWAATAALRFQLRLTAPITRRLALFSQLALDLDPSATRYVVTLDGERHVLLAPWPLRPSVALGVAL